jgi:hypothetical protein
MPARSHVREPLQSVFPDIVHALLHYRHRNKSLQASPSWWCKFDQADAAGRVIRLVAQFCSSKDDEWVAERRWSDPESMKQETVPTLPATTEEIVASIAWGKESVRAARKPLALFLSN